MAANDKMNELQKKREKRRLARKRQVRRQILVIGVLTAVFVVVCVCVNRWITHRNEAIIDQYDQYAQEDKARPAIDVQLLSPNPYSRPGRKLDKVKGIVIHYTGNPGSSAQGNRDYFESLKDSHITKASSHFVVGLNGEIIQCVPIAEISYASNHRNSDTIAIEVCHPDENGEFADATYASLVHLTAWLCNRLDINVEDIIRHYDVTEKICPKYYVEHEDAWIQLKEDIYVKMQELSDL